MTIEQKIRSVVENINGVSYIYDDWYRVNQRLDKYAKEKKLPAIINILPPSGSIEYRLGILKDTANCSIAFADLCNLDFDGIENDGVIDRCKSLAMEFIIKMNDSRLFEPLPENITYRVFWDKLDANVTGIILDLQIREISGISICPGDTTETIITKWRK